MTQRDYDINIDEVRIDPDPLEVFFSFTIDDNINISDARLRFGPNSVSFFCFCRKCFEDYVLIPNEKLERQIILTALEKIKREQQLGHHKCFNNVDKYIEIEKLKKV